MAHLVLATAIVAEIVAGEAGTCDFAARVAVANVVYHRYTIYKLQGWYGHSHPGSMDIRAATVARSVDIVPGAMYVFSDSDLRKLHIEQHPDYIAHCVNGNLSFYVQWPAQQPVEKRNERPNQKPRSASGGVANGSTAVATKSIDVADRWHAYQLRQAVGNDVFHGDRLGRYGDGGVYVVGCVGSYSGNLNSLTYQTFVPLVAYFHTTRSADMYSR